MWRLTGLALLFPLTAAAGSTTEAKPPSLVDAMSAQAYGMGGAYYGLGYNADSVTGNPAAMSMYRRYLLQASGAYDFTNQYGFGTVGIQDSTTEWAAGLAYQFVAYGPQGERRTAHLTTAATSVAINDTIAIGISVRHEAIVGYHSTNSVTMAAGIVVRPFQYMTLGVSGNNLIGVWNDDVPRFFVLTAAGNLPYMITPVFDLRADFNDPHGARFAFAGGVEWIAFDSFPIRAGYDYDQISHTQHVGMGLGYFSAGTGVDIGYRHEINGTNGHLVSLTVKVQFE
jgi:hypothetical protein